MKKKIGFYFLLLFIVIGSQLSTAKVFADSTAETTSHFNLAGDSSSNALTVKNAPSFDFGDLTLSDSQVNATTKGSSDLNITDLRGIGSGWQVQVLMTDFTSDNGSSKLNANLVIGANSISPTDPNNTSGVPSSETVALDSSFQTIFYADQGTGMGSWDADFSSNLSADLSVLSGNKPAHYTATIFWVLADTPQ